MCFGRDDGSRWWIFIPDGGGGEPCGKCLHTYTGWWSDERERANFPVARDLQSRRYLRARARLYPCTDDNGGHRGNDGGAAAAGHTIYRVARCRP